MRDKTTPCPVRGALPATTAHGTCALLPVPRVSVSRRLEVRALLHMHTRARTPTNTHTHTHTHKHTHTHTQREHARSHFGSTFWSTLNTLLHTHTHPHTHTHTHRLLGCATGLSSDVACMLVPCRTHTHPNVLPCGCGPGLVFVVVQEHGQRLPRRGCWCTRWTR